MPDVPHDQLSLLGTDVLGPATAPRLKSHPRAAQYASSGRAMALAEDAERCFWVAWNRVRGIGPARFARLIETFGTAQAAWEAEPSALRAAGFDEKLLGEVVRQRVQIDPAGELERLARFAVAALTLRDADYPRLLREIPAPPA